MSRPLVLLSLGGLIAGIILGELGHPSFWVVILWGGAIGLTVISARVRWIAVILISGLIGLWRVQNSLNITPNDIRRQIGQTMSLSGTVFSTPSNLGDRQMIALKQLTTPGQALAGGIRLYLPSYPIFQVGDKLTVKCQLTEFNSQSARRLLSQGLSALCATPKVIAVGTSHANIKLTLSRWQAATITAVRRMYNEPQASLLAGILLGDIDGMPDQLRLNFQITGTTHIVALSGFNITIIVNVILTILVRLIGRRWAWLPGLVVVIVFVAMTGAAASVVRAALMAGISLVALFAGRPISASRLLAYAGIVMLLVNPLILLHELGFQLSFLATIGLIYLSGPVGRWLSWLTSSGGWRDNLASTLSAIIITEPLLLWRFGRLSLVAPLVNILVLPLIPLAMLMGTIGLAASCTPMLRQLLIAPADMLLRVIIGLIDRGAAMPQAAIMVNVSLASGLAAIFAFIIGHLAYVNSKTDRT